MLSFRSSEVRALALAVALPLIAGGGQKKDQAQQAQPTPVQITLRMTMGGAERWAAVGGSRTVVAALPCAFVLRLERGDTVETAPHASALDSTLARVEVDSEGKITLNLLQLGATKVGISSGKFQRDIEAQVQQWKRPASDQLPAFEKGFQCQVVFPRE